MSDEKDKDVRLNNRDKMIGSFLSKEINKENVDTECPALEDIAAFIDGKLVGIEREKIMDHLSSCNECYEVFSETLKTQEQLSRQSKSNIKQKFYYFLPPVIAVAAVLLIIFKLPVTQNVLKQETVIERNKAEGIKQETKIVKNKESMPIEKTDQNIIVAKKEEVPTTPPKQEKPMLEKKAIEEKYIFTSSRYVDQILSKSKDIKLLNNSVKDYSLTNYLYTDRKYLERISFRLGICLIDLEIAFGAGDKEKSMDIIKKVNSLIQSIRESIKGSLKIVQFYADVLKKIEEGESPKQFAGNSYRTEELFKNSDVFLYLYFGEWVETGRLAAITQGKKFFVMKDVEYFIKNFGGKHLPQELIASLKEIKKIIDKKEMNEKEFKQLEGLFGNLSKIM